MNKPIAETIEALKARVVDSNPIDRRSAKKDPDGMDGGIVNGFTRAAQGFADPEERYKIEVAGASGFIHLN